MTSKHRLPKATHHLVTTLHSHGLFSRQKRFPREQDAKSAEGLITLPVRHAHAHGQLPSPAGLLPPAGLSGFLLKLAGSAPHTAGPRAAMDLKLLVQKVHHGPPRSPEPRKADQRGDHRRPQMPAPRKNSVSFSLNHPLYMHTNIYKTGHFEDVAP